MMYSICADILRFSLSASAFTMSIIFVSKRIDVGCDLGIQKYTSLWVDYNSFREIVKFSLTTIEYYAIFFCSQ